MKPVAKLLRLFFYWMEERQRVYLKRQAGERPPWTKDPILQKYRFCNLYREQDKVTVWLREHWREPYVEHPNLAFAMCMARQVNWPDTLEEIGFPKVWAPGRVLSILRARAARGEKVYTSAYMLTAGGGSRGMDKPEITVSKILDPLWFHLKKIPPPWRRVAFKATLLESWVYLAYGGLYGFGPFIAYEVVSDLRHTRYLCDAPDIMTWANVGPGARRGLNRLYGRPVKDKSVSGPVLLNHMQWLLAEGRKRLPTDVVPTLEMRDIEHSLCEFDKYQRAQEAEASGCKTGLELFRSGNNNLFQYNF